jgi:SAM-dependent methyltransferase
MIKNKKLIWGGVGPLFNLPFLAYFTVGYPASTILDFGCGKGINGYILRANRDMSKTKMIGIDVRKDHVQFTKDRRIYDKIIKWGSPIIPFGDKSLDLILCTEVIEHMSKKDGEKLLGEIDRSCKGRVVITTPNIFIETSSKLDHDTHKSLWTPADFRKMGYKVYGLGFRVDVSYNDRFLKLKQAVNYLFTPLSYLLPQISKTLLCVKDFN